jgi:hypothetical protein
MALWAYASAVHARVLQSMFFSSETKEQLFVLETLLNRVARDLWMTPAASALCCSVPVGQ